ncbi:MAG: PBSX family phage terminase large subunit [Firmicutes bacterium]|nr:PBSX family phage terminase large subunit [Bacillota bacterium]
MAIKLTGIDRAINPSFRSRLFDYSHRINVEYGGAGSGKSHFVTQKTILKACRLRRRILVVRKVGTTIRESIWTLFLDQLSNIRPVVRAVNKTDMTITLVNGSQFIFKGLDDREKIKSITGVDDIVIEEATELTQDDFTQLNLRLRSKRPHNQIHLMFNPVSKANWVFKYFFEQEQPDTVIAHSAYHDNLHLPPAYVQELEHLKNTSPAYYRIYALGEFATLDKLVFPVFTKRLISPSEVANLPLWTGLDFGYTNDPTALTWGRYDASGNKIFVTGDYSRKGMTNEQIYQTICDLGLAKETIVADSAEPKSVDELRSMGLWRLRPAAKGKDSVMHGIDFILRHELIVDERCTGLIEELENYTWQKDKKTGEYINKPIDTFDHNIDAMRYGLELVRRPGGQWVNVKH